MNKKTILALFLIGAISCSAQETNIALQKKFSAGIEFNYPIYYFQSHSTGDWPYINVNGQWRFSRRFALNAAFFPAFQASGQNQNDEGVWENFTISLGGIYYLRISHRLFFEPELDLYLNNVLINQNIHEGSGTPEIQSTNTTYFQLGAGLGFQYFFSPRISLNSCIYNLAYGWALNPNDFISDLYSTRWDIYKAVSLGVKYHFGRPKQ